jgi:SPP1 family phage portal protein
MLTIEEIKQFIDEDRASEKKRRAGEGQQYYEGEHDIKKTRFFFVNSDGVGVEDKIRSNIKISHQFFTELSDQLVAHMLSFTESPIRAKENVEGLQNHLDVYFNAKFWTEIGDLIGGAYNKGFDYVYGYKNEDNRLAIQYADSMGVVEVEPKYASDKKAHIIYHYVDRFDKDKKPVIKIQDWSADEGTYHYIQIGSSGKIEFDDSEAINPKPHIIFKDEKGNLMGDSFGFIPFWRLDNNRKQFSGLKPIKALIDDYDLHACSLSNNLVDFDSPIYAVKGYDGDNLDELFQNLRTKKTIGTDAEGGIDVKTINIPYQARKEKLEIDEKAIYRFGMGFNSSQSGDGNITNVVIKSRYSLLDMKADKLQDRVCGILEDIIKVVLDEINEEHKTAYQISDVEIVFKRDTVTNESENITNEKVKAETEQIKINTILNIIDTIGNEKALQLICDELDVDYNEVKSQLESAKNNDDLNAAKNVLNDVVIDE